MPSAPQQRASCWLFKQNPKKILCHRSFWDLIFNLSLSYIVLKYLSFLSVVWDTARSKLINDICSPMESCCICDQKQEVDEITTFKKIGKGHANCTRRTKGNVVTFLGIVIMQIKVSKMKQRNNHMSQTITYAVYWETQGSHFHLPVQHLVFFGWNVHWSNLGNKILHRTQLEGRMLWNP